MDDDDMPLSGLAKPKKASFGDDVPLAALAAPGGAKKTSGRPAAPKPKAPGDKPKTLTAPGAPKAKAPVKKRVESSSSSDSSSSSTDTSSESGEKKPRGKKRVKLVAKKPDDGDGEDNKVAKRSRSTKEQVAVELLCRWWYVFPDWPPADPEGMARKLAERGLREVSIQEWEWVPELDDKGRKKVYELTQFKGVFRSSDGAKHDLRPMESCPSYNNMMRKEISELYSLLVKAYEGQLKDLDNSKYDADKPDLKNKLSIALTKAREKAHQTSQMTAAKKPKLA
jgi:hypothetical protein